MNRSPVGLPSIAIEDYVKAMFHIEDEVGGVVTTTALAARLGVTASSASAMVKRLAAMGLAAHTP